MHCHGFFKGILFTVTDAIVACVGHTIVFMSCEWTAQSRCFLPSSTLVGYLP